MMKLTVAFLASLAAADAANAHGRRHARRDYPVYGGASSSLPEVPSSTAEAVESTGVFETPYPSDSTIAPAESTAYGSGFPTETVVSETSYPSDSTVLPAESTAYGSGFPETIVPSSTEYPEASTPEAVESTEVPEASTSAYEIPTGTDAIPSFTGTGGYSVPSVPESTFPVEDTTAVPSFPGTGVPTYASTGVPEASTEVPTYATTGPASPETTAADYVTSVIYSTQTFTVTACPSTVTDCPADSTKTVTSVVPIGTTVCPKDEASVTPESTYAPVESKSVEISKTPVSEVTHVQTKTYTYNVGTGSTAHPVTTEYTTTSTETIYKTLTITKEHVPSQETGVPEVPSEEEGYPTVPAGGEATPTGTTTIKTTSTTTKTITVYPTPDTASTVEAVDVPTAPATPGNGHGNGEGEGEGECAAPVTVTVTAQETITVTAEHEGHAPTHVIPEGGETSTYEVPSEETGYPTGPKPTGPHPTGPPYPHGNGTHPTFGHGHPHPTGFVTYTKPTGEEVPSETEVSSLPHFSLPSETEVESTALPEETAYPTATPAPTESYGNGYNSYLKRFRLW